MFFVQIFYFLIVTKVMKRKMEGGKDVVPYYPHISGYHVNSND